MLFSMDIHKVMQMCVLYLVGAGNTEDKKVPTLVQAFADHKMVGVDCGSGDAHTLFLEDNGQYHLDSFSMNKS